MKIKVEHMAHMRSAIELALKAHPEARDQYKEAGLSAKRFRWDALNKAGLTPWLCSDVYSYANDSHIDTALRAILGDW
jgi:hypothetical protein